MKNIKLILLALLILNTRHLFPQNVKFPIEIRDNAEDRVGKSLVYLVKEGIKKSSDFRVTYDDSEIPRIILFFNSMDRYKDENEGLATIYSVFWVISLNDGGFLYYHFLDHTMGYVGSYHIEEASRTLIAKNSEVYEGLLRYLTKLKNLMNED